MPTPTQRCIQLFRLLLERGSLSTAQAQQLTGADKKSTVLRDLKVLASVVPELEKAGEGQDSRWVMASSSVLMRPRIQNAIAMELGRELASFLHGSGLQAGLEGTAPRLLEEALLPHMQRNLSRKFRLQHEPHRSYEGMRDRILDLLDGLLRERELTIRYRPFRSEDRLYERLWPLTLVLYRRGVYLQVSRPNKSRVFDLAVERIQEIEVGGPFPYPQDWRPDPVLRQRFGMVSGGEPEAVRIRFAADVAEWAKARIWHPSQELVELDDGCVELRMLAAGPELKRLALEWGDHCEVLEPQWLREQLLETARRMLSRYGGER